MKQREKKTVMRNNRTNKILFAFIVTIVFAFGANAATLSPQLTDKLTNLAGSASLGMVIISFNRNDGLQQSHLNILQSVRITGGQTFQNLGMVAQPLTAGQVRALQNNSAVRSFRSNDQLMYFMNRARTPAGVDFVRSTSAFTTANGGI